MKISFLPICILLTSLVTGQQLQSSPRAITPESVEAFFDITFEAQKLEHELVGVTVAVVKDGKVILKKGYGFADLEKRIPVDPDKHLFRIASISKTFTWTAIMQLVEQGKLDLEADIQQYLDFDIPDTYPEPIQLKHLLTHTGGFEEVASAGFAQTSGDVVPLSSYLQAHIPARVRKPGTYISYSNYGSAVAGYIVERVSGIPWADYIQQNILDPLEMTETNIHQPMSADHKQSHAKGYKYQAGNYKATDYWFEQEAPAGVMSSTANNMSTWMLAHLNNGQYKSQRILRPETTKQMQSSLFQQHPDALPVFHGFYRTDRNGIQTFGHGGDVNQFHSNLSIMPDHDLGVFVSFNSDPASQARSNIVLAFLNYFFPAEYPEVLAANPIVNLDEYVGGWLNTRRNHSSFEKLALLVSGIQITADNQELVISSATNTSRWIPVAPDHFRAKYENRVMLFYRDKDGAVNHFSGTTGLGSFERVKWYESSGLHQILFGGIALISLVHLFRFVKNLFSKTLGQNSSTPIKRTDLWVSAISSALILVLLVRLVITLTGNTDQFLYGVPDSVEITFLLALAAIPLSALMVFLCSRQWTQGQGSVSERIHYGLVVFSSLIFVGQFWFWNILTYYFK